MIVDIQAVQHGSGDQSDLAAHDNLIILLATRQDLWAFGIAQSWTT